MFLVSYSVNSDKISYIINQNNTKAIFFNLSNYYKHRAKEDVKFV